MKIIFLIILTSLAISFNGISQPFPRTSGVSGNMFYSGNMAYGLGYATTKSGFYKKNEQYPIQSKYYFLLNETSLNYAPTNRVWSLNFSNSISLLDITEPIRNSLFGLKFGIDLMYQTNFSTNEFLILPKISITFFYGVAEFSYRRNVLFPNDKVLSSPNHFVLTLRPFIMLKNPIV